MECPGLLRKLSLIHKLCYLNRASNSEVEILSTWQKRTPVATNMFALSLPAFSPVAFITLRASAGKGHQKSSVSHCPIHNVRQHSDNASETSIWRELTASNHEIHHFSSSAQTCPPVDLRIHDVGCPELLGKLSLIPKLCSLSWHQNVMTGS